jgi:hypothetical protein
MEDGTKGAAAVLDYQGGQVCNKYRSFFFRVRPKSKESSGILWQLPLGQGSLMITQPRTNSANLTGLENSQVSKPRRSLEKIGRRSQSIMEKKMIPQNGGSPWSQYWVALANAGPARESEKHQPQWSHRGDPDRGDRETDLRISLQIPIGITEKHPTIF